MNARCDGLTDEQRKAVVEALPEIHRLAGRLARRCHHKRVQELRTMAEDFFMSRARRWDPAKGKLFGFARKDVERDLIRAAHQERGRALDRGLRAMHAQEDAIAEPDAARRWAESVEEKEARALALGQDQAFCGFYGYSTAHAQSPEDAYGSRESVEVMKREASSIDPRAPEIIGLRYEHDLTWEEAAARMGLDPRQAQRIEERAFDRLRAIFDPRERRPQ